MVGVLLYEGLERDDAITVARSERLLGVVYSYEKPIHGIAE